jgi:hypothetical protein
MKVYIGYEYDNEHGDEYRAVAKVFDSEAKARSWVEEFEATDLQWRDYSVWEVE